MQISVDDDVAANKAQVMRSETLRLQHEQSVMKEKIRDNGEKIKQNKVLPYLVGNVVEVRNLSPPRFGEGLNLFRFWMLTPRSRRMVLIKTWIRCVKENVLSSKPLPVKLCSYP